MGRKGGTRTERVGGREGGRREREVGWEGGEGKSR